MYRRSPEVTTWKDDGEILSEYIEHIKASGFDGQYSDNEFVHYVRLISPNELGKSKMERELVFDKICTQIKSILNNSNIDPKTIKFVFIYKDAVLRRKNDFEDDYIKPIQISFDPPINVDHLTESDIKSLWNSLETEQSVSIDIDLTNFLSQCEGDSTSPMRTLPSLCVPTIEGSNYTGFLTYIPGELLYKISNEFPWQLYQMNVRMEIEVKKSKVSTSIVRTITKEKLGDKTKVEPHPKNFFAFNNGLVIVAKKVIKDSTNNISFLKGVSIVNGAQTTGSIREAFKSLIENSKDLPDFYVPAKVIEINDDKDYENLGHDVCLFANKQNKVTSGSHSSKDPVWIKIQNKSEESELGWFIESRSDMHRLKLRDDHSFRRKFPQAITYDHVIISLSVYHNYPDIICEGPATSTKKWLEGKYHDLDNLPQKELLTNEPISSSFLAIIVNSFILYNVGLRETLTHYIKSSPILVKSPSKQVAYILSATYLFSRLDEDISKDHLRKNKHLLDRWIDLMTEATEPITQLLVLLNEKLSSNFITYTRSESAREEVVNILNNIETNTAPYSKNISLPIDLASNLKKMIDVIKNWEFHISDYALISEPKIEDNSLNFDTIDFESNQLEELLDKVYQTATESDNTIHMPVLLSHLSTHLEVEIDHIWEETRRYWLTKFRAGHIRLKDFKNLYKGKSHDVLIYAVTNSSEID